MNLVSRLICKTIAFAAMVGSQTQLAVISPETGDWGS
jgi:hypothetical protein